MVLAFLSFSYSFLFFLLLTLYLYLQFVQGLPSPINLDLMFTQVNSQLTQVVVIPIICSSIIFITILRAENILKGFASRWDYAKYFQFSKFLQVVAGCATITAFYVFLNINSPELLVVKYEVLLLALIVIMTAYSFLDFYNVEGKAVLTFLSFLSGYKKNPKYANFEKILEGSKHIGKVARKRNMEINPYSLSLGLSCACMQNKKCLKDDLLGLISWVEHPRTGISLENFKNTIKKYGLIALEFNENGITEKKHYSIEQVISLVNILVIPFAVVVLTVILPELIKIIKF